MLRRRSIRAFTHRHGITLNITRGEMAANGWCPSGRFFEAAACGTPLITDPWEGLDSFFDLRTNFALFLARQMWKTL